MNRMIPIIGLEVHVQLKTNSKMFCSCPNLSEDASPNTAICPVCTSQPGALPALNQRAIELGVKTGLALNCRIPDTSAFDRKNYFYPDLPKGYQISQYRLPVAVEGHLNIHIPEGEAPRQDVKIGITRAHLEEDAAKNTHTSTGTAVDFNRAGTPLLEIVSEPDLRTPQEAKAYLQELRGILKAIGASDADMEKGQMRCDANISLLEIDENRRPTQAFLNPKIEIKNLNSFRAVERALTYEINRQQELYDRGEVPVGSTRGWDENTGHTFEQRLKETNADYRYFPEPDLPPQDLIAIRERFTDLRVELPAEKRARLQEESQFSASDVSFFVTNEGWAEYAEHVMDELACWMEATDDSDKSGSQLLEERKKKLSKLVGGWLTSKLAGLMAERGLTIKTLKISPEDFAEFIHLIDTGKINSANAQKLLALMVDSGTDPSHLMEDHDLGQTMDTGKLQEIIDRLARENPDQVAQVKAGKLSVLKWFVGSAMKITEGKANPAVAEELIKKAIGV